MAAPRWPRYELHDRSPPHSPTTDCLRRHGVSQNLSLFGGCVRGRGTCPCTYQSSGGVSTTSPPHLSLNNLVKRQNEREEERESLCTPPTNDRFEITVAVPRLIDTDSC